MKYMKDFSGFINENSRVNEANQNEFEAQKELITALQKAPASEVDKVMQSAQDLADEHRIEVEKLADPRLAVELLLKNAAKSNLTESSIYGELEEGVISDWWERTKGGLKKLAIKVGLYGGIAGAISSLAGTAAAATMAGYDPTSPGYKGSTWPWFQEMCHSIYPKPEDMTNSDYRGYVASILMLGFFISAGVAFYSAGKNYDMEQQRKYGKF